MIYLEMAGRLGNQLFRYSFAKKISLLCNEELVIDFKRVYEKGDEKDGWKNSLNLFKVSGYKEENNSKKKNFIKQATIKQLYYYYYYKIGSKLLKANKDKLKKWQLKMQPVMNKNNLYFLELGFYNYDFSYLKNNKVKYVCGCFECSKYFESISDVIKNEIQPKAIDTSKNSKMYEKIINSESVCITIRRGDFITNEKNKALYDICDVNYFETAIKIIKEKVDNPIFFVFSDDIEWAKKNIDFFDSEYFAESGDDTLEEKLRLMSSCKHFIISNSTFSWWAQFLSTNEKKIVISPDKWYATGLDSDLIEEEWIKIPINKKE